MSTCDKIKNWNNLTSDEKLEILETIAKDYLKKHGISDDVNVKEGDLQNTKQVGNWDNNNDKITIDKKHLENDCLKKVLDTTFHETEHAIKDKTGGHEVPIDEEDNFEKDTVIFKDEKYADGERIAELWPAGTPTNEEHREIYLKGSQAAKDFIEECKKENISQESNSINNLREGNWRIDDNPSDQIKP